MQVYSYSVSLLVNNEIFLQSKKVFLKIDSLKTFFLIYKFALLFMVFLILFLYPNLLYLKKNPYYLR